MKIVIVEDEQRARVGLKRLIEGISDQYEVIAEAADGIQGIEVIQALRPDVVITDIKMPYMNGIEMIQRIRLLDIDAQVVILSAYEDFSYAKQAISLNVSEYLVKPILYQEVVETLKRVYEINQGKSEDYQDIRAKYGGLHVTILKALQILEKNYVVKINQGELAEQLGVTQEYFSYLFNKEMGISYSKYLNELRINKAKALISSKDFDKEEIPYKVGFSDAKYFNKVFKEQEKISFAQYLKNNI